MKNINQLFKQAQQMQQQMMEMQQKMQEITVEGQSGAGMVKVTITGKGELQRLQIDPSLVNKEEIDVLEDLIVAAFNDAKQKADAQMAEEMSKVTGGLSLPGGFKMPF